MQAWKVEPKWQEWLQWLCNSGTRRERLVSQGRCPRIRLNAREGADGKGKLSDEVPGKAPRLNTVVGRTKMEMQNAKTSGTSFLQRSVLHDFSLEVKEEVSRGRRFQNETLCILMDHAFIGTMAKNNIVLQLHFGAEGKRLWCAEVSDGRCSCNADEQKMIVSIWCSTTSYNMPPSILDPHNSQQKAQQSCLRPGTPNTVSTVIHLNPYRNNFKFRFPGLLIQHFCLHLYTPFHQ